MNRVPRVNMTGTGEVIFKCSNHAKEVAEVVAKRSRPSALVHEEVHKNAVKELEQEGLKDPSLFDIRGQYRLQLGKYFGQTFHWLAENDIGYATFIVASSMREGSFTDTPLGNNKKQLKVTFYFNYSILILLLYIFKCHQQLLLILTVGLFFVRLCYEMTTISYLIWTYFSKRYFRKYVFL